MSKPDIFASIYCQKNNNTTLNCIKGGTRCRVYAVSLLFSTGIFSFVLYLYCMTSFFIRHYKLLLNKKIKNGLSGVPYSFTQKPNLTKPNKQTKTPPSLTVLISK